MTVTVNQDDAAVERICDGLLPVIRPETSVDVLSAMYRVVASIALFMTDEDAEAAKDILQQFHDQTLFALSAHAAGAAGEMGRA